MTVNRITDEQLKRIVNCKGDFYGENKCKGEDVNMAQELLTLRRENARLRKRIEVGDELHKLAILVNVNCSNFHHTKRNQHALEDDCPLEEQFIKTCEKWRESGVE